ncbi:MAG: Coenzyme F420 hydrogenase/dehydrogenase, beta subunit C-terminal domain [Planctomycetes bacterium]|nr:Coenzyme F420 hydrogenase/dehydrogenase, beta subunit C-terminal domain [Planctomycetota bacterium]
MPSVFAAWHLDESIRRDSSSGGVFSALAENVLARNGAVVGAAFDDQLTVRHILIEVPEDLPRLRGSKYVQSEVTPVLYRRLQDQLRQGRPVLFSGTPCQVAAVRGFLGKSYDTLFCCDLLCHGVPSPLMFRHYVSYLNEVHGHVRTLYFRDKRKGWKHYGMCRHLTNGCVEWFGQQTDPYLLAFLRDYSLRESCYRCAFANVVRGGDLTLADFWGVAKRYPQYDRDDHGTSLVLANTEKGKTWLEKCRQRLFLGIADLDTAIAGNPVLARSCPRPAERDSFYRDLRSLPFAALIHTYRLHRPTRFRRFAGEAKRRLRSVLSWLGGRSVSGGK